MGAHQSPDKDCGQSGISFLMGPESIHVLILTPEDLARRNAIIDAVLNLSTLRSQYGLIYLAAPRLLGASMDASLFRSRGLGLLFFDERRIDEAVTPQPIQPTPSPAASPVQDPAVVNEVATLKSMYLDMERTLNQLRDDLTNLRQPTSLREEPPRFPEPVRAVTTPQIIVANGSPSAGTLPSYFTNNPWLDVLSRRGTGEQERIAG